MKSYNTVYVAADDLVSLIRRTQTELDRVYDIVQKNAGYAADDLPREELTNLVHDARALNMLITAVYKFALTFNIRVHKIKFPLPLDTREVS